MEGNHLDAELLSVFGNEGLGVIWAVEVLAGRVLTGAGVVTADNEVGDTVVLSDNGVPESLTGTTHAHGEGQKGKRSHAVGVSGHETLVDAYTGVVVDVTGLSHTDDRVNEHVSLALTGSTDGELTMSAVHWVSGLESNNLPPGDLVKVLSELGRGVSKLDVVIVGRLGDGLDATTDVEVLDALVEVGDGRVGSIVRAKDSLGLTDLVNGVNIVNGENGDSVVVTRVTEDNPGALLEAKGLNLVLIDIEGNRHGEEGTVGEPHVVKTAVVVGLVHETLKRRETTVDDELKVTELSLREDDLGERGRLLDELSGDGGIPGEQVLKDSSVRCVSHCTKKVWGKGWRKG